MEDGPSRWRSEDCHARWDGGTICLEAHGMFMDKVSESGRLISIYADTATLTNYAPDGALENTERRKVHLVAHGPDGESNMEHESFQYSYESEGYSCQYSYQLRVVDGEVRLDHQVGDCSLVG